MTVTVTEHMYTGAQHEQFFYFSNASHFCQATLIKSVKRPAISQAL